MTRYDEPKSVSLEDLKKRIKSTDLIPSRIALLEQMDDYFSALKKQGIQNLADLRTEQKNEKNIRTLAQKTSIDFQYLILLRREIEGYIPKPFPLRDFNWLPEEESKKLEEAGLKNSHLLYEALNTAKKRADLSISLGIKLPSLEYIYSLVDLTRIQWTSPLTARMLASAGFSDTHCVANADADTLCHAIAHANERHQFFKGKIGLRDVKRLVHAAGYVP